MIKVFFDHQKFSTQKYGGISRYFANLVTEIENSKREFSSQVGVLISDNYYLNAIKQERRFARTVKALTGISNKNAYKVNELYCNSLLKKNEFDIFHPTYYDPYFLSKLRKPFVTTIHDMTYERLPEYFWASDPLTHHKRIHIEQADKIIAISETTKSDLIKYTQAKADRIEVIYHGIDLDSPISVKEVSNLPEKYLLFVGDRSGYKNFYLFMRAYAILRKKYTSLQVILAGGGEMQIAELEFLKTTGVEAGVRLLQVDDAELNYLYKNALVFIYPSLHEGFGLPILEAFRAECPVLLSNTDCFREVAADAAHYFEMHEVDDLISKMESLIDSDSIRDKLISAGKERVEKFPMQNCMAQTLALYKTLL